MRHAKAEIQDLKKNFRGVVLSSIVELKDTGTIQKLDELIQLTPAGLFEMIPIKGLGGKKLRMLWTKAGVENMDQLMDACRKNKIAKLFYTA